MSPSIPLRMEGFLSKTHQFPDDPIRHFSRAMLMIVFGAGCLLLSVLFHAASLLHLSLPLLYALIVPTLFSGWYYSHYALANGIWYALIVLGLISWGVSLARKIRSVIR